MDEMQNMTTITPQPWWRKNLLLWCCLLLCVLNMPMLITDVIPDRDVMVRYAPMAEAFAKGNYLYAFHPRTGFLHTFTAGIIAKLSGLDGFTACKLSSMLFMMLAIFPLYSMTKRIFSRKIAEYSVLFYLICSQLQRLTTWGLRDSHKLFLLMLASYSLIRIYQDREKWGGYIWLAVSIGGGIITRGDMILYMGILFFWGMVMELKISRIPYRSFASSVIAACLTIPSIITNEKLAGMAVPEVRFSIIFEKIMHRLPGLTDTCIIALIVLVLCLIAAIITRKIIDLKYGYIFFLFIGAMYVLGLILLIVLPFYQLEYTDPDFIVSILKGYFPALLILAVIGIIFKIWKKEWTRADSILVILSFSHTVLIIGQVLIFDKYLFVSHRYLLPAAILEIPFAVYGLQCLWDFLTTYQNRYLPPKLLRTVAILGVSALCIGMLIDLYAPILKASKPKQRKYEQESLKMAEFIRNDYKGPKFAAPKIDPNHYVSNRRPVLYFIRFNEEKQSLFFDYGRITSLTWNAGGRWTIFPEEADYVIEKQTVYYKPAPNMEKITEMNVGKATYNIWRVKK